MPLQVTNRGTVPDERTFLIRAELLSADPDTVTRVTDRGDEGSVGSPSNYLKPGEFETRKRLDLVEAIMME